MVQKHESQAKQLLDEHKITSESLNQAINKSTNTEAKNQVNKQLPTYINQYRLLSTTKIASIENDARHLLILVIIKDFELIDHKINLRVAVISLHVKNV